MWVFISFPTYLKDIVKILTQTMETNVREYNRRPKPHLILSNARPVLKMMQEQSFSEKFISKSIIAGRVVVCPYNYVGYINQVCVKKDPIKTGFKN